MNAKPAPRKPVLPNVVLACVIVLMLAVGYVLSYPIVAQFTYSVDIPPYRPVQWLIDKTPAREPIFWCARVMRCGLKVERAYYYREAIRSQSERVGVPWW